MSSPISTFITYCEKYGSISAPLYALLEKHIIIETITKGELYLKKGTISRKQAFIVDGLMRHIVLDQKGNEQTSLFITVNDFAGDVESCMHNTPSDKSIEAIETSTYMYLTDESNKLISAQFPEWDHLTSLMLLDFLNTIVNRKTFLTQNDSLTNYTNFINTSPTLINRIPLGMIASYLGITQQSLSRLRSQK